VIIKIYFIFFRKKNISNILYIFNQISNYLTSRINKKRVQDANGREALFRVVLLLWLAVGLDVLPGSAVARLVPGALPCACYL